MQFFDKLKSRKFIAAVIGVLTGIAMVFGIDKDVITTVSGAVISAASLITYIVVEGKIDAAAIAETVSKIKEAAEEVSDSD